MNAMGLYMLQFTYTADAWAAMTSEPADRSQGIDRLCQAHGGRLVDLYYSFSDVDGVVLIDVPDHTAASGVALTALAQGHIKTYKMIPLLTAAETVEVMRKAGAISYSGPNSPRRIGAG
jgi:uncharacterized protein with GYD domain